MCVSLDTLHAGLLRQACMRKTVDEPRRGFVDGLRGRFRGPALMCSLRCFFPGTVNGIPAQSKMHMRPLQPSLAMRWMVFCSFCCTASGILLDLPAMLSRTRS